MNYTCDLTSPCQKLVSSGCNADLGGCRKSPTLPLRHCWRSAGTSRPRPMAGGEPRQPLPGSSLLCILLRAGVGSSEQGRAATGPSCMQHVLPSSTRAAHMVLLSQRAENAAVHAALCPTGGSMLQVAHSAPAATLVATSCRAGWQHSRQSKPAAVVQVTPCQSRGHSPGVDSLCHLFLAAHQAHHTQAK